MFWHIARVSEYFASAQTVNLVSIHPSAKEQNLILTSFEDGLFELSQGDADNLGLHDGWLVGRLFDIKI
jgi:hypothetical protein